MLLLVVLYHSKQQAKWWQYTPVITILSLAQHFQAPREIMENNFFAEIKVHIILGNVFK